jgi:hypothetical protein
MTIKQIGSPDPKYLAATDILIGDMSDINYEFLIYDRPIILLANYWLRENFPDIGIKTDLNSLKAAIERSIKKPEEFSESRKYWLNKTMLNPDGNSSNRVLDVVLRYSNIKEPFIILLHGNNEVLKTHLADLYEIILKRNIRVEYTDYFCSEKHGKDKDLICISASNMLMEGLNNSFNVHIDHGVKGPGTTDMEADIMEYKKKSYFPSVNLHITEGKASLEKTRIFLGPYRDRAIMVGYTKSDTLIRLNSLENRSSVCEELGFDPNKLIITYAPAGKYSYPFKQGASLSYKTIKHIYEIAKHIKYNFLIKLKFPEKPISLKIIEKIKEIF